MRPACFEANRPSKREARGSLHSGDRDSADFRGTTLMDPWSPDATDAGPVRAARSRAHGLRGHGLAAPRSRRRRDVRKTAGRNGFRFQTGPTPSMLGPDDRRPADSALLREDLGSRIVAPRHLKPSVIFCPVGQPSWRQPFLFGPYRSSVQPPQLSRPALHVLHCVWLD